MNKRKIIETKTAVSGGIYEACARYGLGKISMKKLADEAGATIHVGRRVILHFGKIDAYLEQQAGNQA